MAKKLIIGLVLALGLAFAGSFATATPVEAQCSLAGNIEECGSELIIPADICSDALSCIRAGINIVFLLAVVLALIYLIWGGVDYITSGGNEEQVGAAREKITNAVIGLVIIILSWAIMVAVTSFFGQEGVLEDIEGGGDQSSLELSEPSS